MIKRLPRYAETRFAEFCAEAGVLCHHAEEDESGWDYLIEFPAQRSFTPADTHPPPTTAFVQVKSTSTNKLSCFVKLSTARRAALDTEPWFVVLMRKTIQDESPRIFAVDVWEDIIR